MAQPSGKIKQSELEIWHKFTEWFTDHDALGWIFRGEDKTGNPLRPKIGRPEAWRGDYPYHYRNEVWLFDEFKRRAAAFISDEALPATPWEWLALAQHHGLPTRLLDWSYSALVAAFFAVETRGQKGHAIVYAYKPQHVLFVPASPHPFWVDEVLKFDPVHTSRRIIAQSATFTVHPKPFEAFSPNERFDQFIIPQDACLGFKSRLNNLGVNKASLFPGLDGVAAHLSFLNTIVSPMSTHPVPMPVHAMRKRKSTRKSIDAAMLRKMLRKLPKRTRRF